jgi:hypothetical protein
MANRDISTKQKAAIRALLTGASYPEAAAAAKVHPNTIGEWMKDAAFLEALHQAESDAMKAVSRSLVSIADKAAGVLAGILDDPAARDSSKVRAADVVLGRLLEIRGMAELEARIQKLEEVRYESENAE